ncbi:MAG: LysM peptidoglycan-binding domain-containing protein, partial [Myxococcales bacterium]|nr:LysM peptidoglycan-binding domain-containing protein [Myxococcales bacterium]
MRGLAPIVFAVWPTLALARHPPIAVAPYTVQAGDTCASIAKARYGDAGRYDIIHQFNPQLGPTLPHHHEPGDVLQLPKGIPSDAWVTEVVRTVEQRAASEATWQPAVSGTPLSVGHRVTTRDQAAAELTFQDDSTVDLLENTLLVVYGRRADESQARPNRARLERGTLRSRLAELRGEGLALTAGTAEAELSGSAALMSVDPEGLVCVSNHAGEQVAVASAAAPTQKVAVPAGQGTRVPKGQPPEPPRPLPPPPTWSAGAETALGGTGPEAVVDLAWAGPADAGGWRLDVSRDGAPVASAALPADRLGLRLTGLPAG